MSASIDPRVTASRYQGDVALLEAIRSDPRVRQEVAQIDTASSQDMLRTALLAQAVRISSRLIPTVHSAFETLRRRTGIDGEIEAYVVPSPGINAFVTRGGNRTFVVFHGETINNLSAEELLFVIGHELGHATHGHHEVVERRVFDRLDPRRRMQLLALSRAQEISADRVGLLCCEDLEVAARALFKCASGLTLAGLAIDLGEFDAQWDHYVQEVIEVGADQSHGLMTHPLPHLRIRALRLFWEAGLKPGNGLDGTVDELLAVLDPLARERPDAADPLLADFFLWGGLYMGLAHGEIDEAERDKLASVTSPARLAQALAGGVPTPEQCLNRFQECLTRRRQKLTAGEISRMLDGLVQIAKADQTVEQQELTALRQLAGVLKVDAELFIAG